MPQIDEIVINDIVNEYYNNFLIQKNKLNNSTLNLENNLLVDKTHDISRLINQKILMELEKFENDFTKLENWWKRYLDSVNELNSGLVSNSGLTLSDNSEYLEAKNLLNNEIE